MGTFFKALQSALASVWSSLAGKIGVLLGALVMLRWIVGAAGDIDFISSKWELIVTFAYNWQILVGIGIAGVLIASALHASWDQHTGKLAIPQPAISPPFEIAELKRVKSDGHIQATLSFSRAVENTLVSVRVFEHANLADMTTNKGRFDLRDNLTCDIDDKVQITLATYKEVEHGHEWFWGDGSGNDFVSRGKFIVAEICIGEFVRRCLLRFPVMTNPSNLFLKHGEAPETPMEAPQECLMLTDEKGAGRRFRGVKSIFDA